MFSTLLLFGIPAVMATVLVVLLLVMFRVVVPTNEVHIVQSSKRTTPYGKGETSGNTYYKWPSWVPRFGVRTIMLPVSVFDVTLENYAAYDKGRLPFVIDIMAFFRVTDAGLAAQRVSTVAELNSQLQGILQGACRTILATSEIEEILEGRASFGQKFTEEVDANLKQWGVQTVKCIELMDIRDAKDSKVIAQIMAKKQSLIDMQSRTEVAANKRTAELAEIEAQQTVEVRKQEAQQQVGIRTAEQQREVGIANQQAQQHVNMAAKETAETEMAVSRVELVRKAEIDKDVQIVAAEQEKQRTIIVAEGRLEEARRNAQGVEAEGIAQGVAERAKLMAPVDAQIALADKIASSDGYQRYLIAIRAVEKEQAVGTAQAEALKVAEIKVIANGGDVTSGVTSVMDLFTSKGGTQLAGMLEAVQQSPAGAALVGKLARPNGAAV